jgi:uncharacterized FAD-dependent dehydrogenase
MPRIVNIELKPHQCIDQESIRGKIRDRFNCANEPIVLLKKSLDARSRKNIHFKIRAQIGASEEEQSDRAFEGERKLKGTCHIIGFGPAGMFAAMELLENGIKPIVIERGKAVKERRRDLAALNKELLVDPDSNYCFGEGGAGTYSDGKLYTRSKKRGSVERILKSFVQFGANDNILYEAHPHIGTNKLPAIIEKMRAFILEHGGEIHFNSRLTDVDYSQGKIQSITVNNNDQMAVEDLILATGHSARDVYTLLKKKNIEIELKLFALGVRIEHPQDLVDEMQYHCSRGEYLPPASYRIVNQVKERGVFSFCMCPGGIIAPASTDVKETVVNGWSPSKRNGAYANSGLVVQLYEQDFAAYSQFEELAGMMFQKEVEQKCFESTGSIVAASQAVGDFVQGKQSTKLNDCSYVPGIQSVKLDEVLPEFITSSLREGIQHFGKRMKGYDSNEGNLVATESRTSSPVRIPRDKETLQHPQLRNFYPCGEGAGYAGGIVSAAIDGMRCTLEIVKKRNEK